MGAYWDKAAGLIRLRCDRPEGHSAKDEAAFRQLELSYVRQDLLDSLLADAGIEHESDPSLGVAPLF
jgi:hypothetical protein